MLKELEDRFGPPPPAVQNLLDYALLKAQAEKMGRRRDRTEGCAVSVNFIPNFGEAERL